MAFVWRHGEWALRDCDDCRRYVFKDGKVLLDGEGEPVPNPSPPECRRTPCGSRADKPRLEKWQLEVLSLWRTCRRYRTLPRAGGVVDQDAFLMDVFAALDALQAEIEREELERIRKGK